MLTKFYVKAQHIAYKRNNGSFRHLLPLVKSHCVKIVSRGREMSRFYAVLQLLSAIS